MVLVIWSGAKQRQQTTREREREARQAAKMLLLRRRREPAGAVLVPAIAILVLLVLAGAAAGMAEEALSSSLPTEFYFSAAELSRIAGYGEEPVSSVSVSGQLTCELCLRPGSQLLTLEIPGAKVAVTCESEWPTPNSQSDNNFASATTDEYGNFTIDLPSQLHATPYLEKACTFEVLQLPADSSCRLRHRPSDTYPLRLSYVQDGDRAYTAGVIRLQSSDTPSESCERVESSLSGRR